MYGGCSCGMSVAHHTDPYSTKIHTVKAYFYHCSRVTRSQAVLGWSQIISLHGLSSKYGNMCLTLQCLQVFSQSCEKLTDAIKHSDVSGTSELLIIHFKWYGIIAQSAALYTCTHVQHTFTLHTCFSCIS